MHIQIHISVYATRNSESPKKELASSHAHRIETERWDGHSVINSIVVGLSLPLQSRPPSSCGHLMHLIIDPADCAGQKAKKKKWLVGRFFGHMGLRLISGPADKKLTFG